MEKDFRRQDVRRETTNELLYHLEKNEVSDEDKEILYNMFVSKNYGTDLQRERFIGCFNLDLKGKPFKNYSAYARSISRTYSSVIQAVTIFRIKINRRNDTDDFIQIDKINIRSRKQRGN